MNIFNRSLSRICGSAGLLVCTASGGFAADITLQRVPQRAEAVSTAEASTAASEARLGPQATFALINFDVMDRQNKARAVYVSSGDDLTTANNMIDNQVKTEFGFSAEDKSPTTILDLGQVQAVRRLSLKYSAHSGSMDVYLMQSLPGTIVENSAGTRVLDTNALTNLKRTASLVDDGSQGQASMDFPAVSGRYLLLRWNPASQADGTFAVSEVSAFGKGGANLFASNVNFSSTPQATTRRTQAIDSKDVPDSKDIAEAKDIPAEGPAGGPPGLPLTPTFSFIPQVPIPITPVINPTSL